MRVVNYTEFRKNLAGNLNTVNDNAENVVVMSLEEYNSIQETLQVVSTPANQKRLEEALKEMRAGKTLRHKLNEN